MVFFKNIFLSNLIFIKIQILTAKFGSWFCKYLAQEQSKMTGFFCNFLTGKCNLDRAFFAGFSTKCRKGREFVTNILAS